MTTYTGAAARTRGAPPRGGRHRQQPKPATPRAAAQRQSGTKVLVAGLIGTAALAGAYTLTSHIEGARLSTPDSLGAKQLLGPGNQSAEGARTPIQDTTASDSQTATLTASLGPLPSIFSSGATQTANPGANYLSGIAPSTTSDLLPTPAGRGTTNAFGFGVSGGLTFQTSPDSNNFLGITNVIPSFGVNVAIPTKIGNSKDPNAGGNGTFQIPFGNQGSAAGQSSQSTFSSTGGSVSDAGLAQTLNPNIYQLTQNAVNSFFQTEKDLGLNSPFAIVPPTSVPGTVTVGQQEYYPVPYLNVTNQGLDAGSSFAQRFDAGTFPAGTGLVTIPGVSPLVSPVFGVNATNQGLDAGSSFAQRFDAVTSTSPAGTGLVTIPGVSPLVSPVFGVNATNQAQNTPTAQQDQQVQQALPNTAPGQVTIIYPDGSSSQAITLNPNGNSPIFAPQGSTLYDGITQTPLTNQGTFVYGYSGSSGSSTIPIIVTPQYGTNPTTKSAPGGSNNDPSGDQQGGDTSGQLQKVAMDTTSTASTVSDASPGGGQGAAPPPAQQQVPPPVQQDPPPAPVQQDPPPAPVQQDPPPAPVQQVQQDPPPAPVQQDPPPAPVQQVQEDPPPPSAPIYVAGGFGDPKPA